jgi:hypothetical protein
MYFALDLHSISYSVVVFIVLHVFKMWHYSAYVGSIMCSNSHFDRGICFLNILPYIMVIWHLYFVFVSS